MNFENSGSSNVTTIVPASTKRRVSKVIWCNLPENQRKKKPNDVTTRFQEKLLKANGECNRKFRFAHEKKHTHKNQIQLKEKPTTTNIAFRNERK